MTCSILTSSPCPDPSIAGSVAPRKRNGSEDTESVQYKGSARRTVRKLDLGTRTVTGAPSVSLHLQVPTHRWLHAETLAYFQSLLLPDSFIQQTVPDWVMFPDSWNPVPLQQPEIDAMFVDGILDYSAVRRILYSAVHPPP